MKNKNFIMIIFGALLCLILIPVVSWHLFGVPTFLSSEACLTVPPELSTGIDQAFDLRAFIFGCKAIQ